MTNVLLALLMLVVLTLSYSSNQRTIIWHDDMSLLNQAISQAYPDTSLYLNRGLAKYNNRDYQGALADFNQSLMINNENLTAHYNRGLLLSKNFQRHHEALIDLDLVIQYRPTPAAYYERGNVKILLNDQPGALADYSQAISLKNDWLYYFVRANTYGQIKQYAAALKDYQQAIDLAPDFASAYYYKGLTFLNLKQNSEACEVWRQGAAAGLKLGPALAKLCPNK